MGGGAEAVETDLFAIAGDDQRTPTDQPGAQQGGQGYVVPDFAERKSEARINDRRRREAAIAIPTRSPMVRPSTLGPMASIRPTIS
jgi:hypothetical protein